MTIHSKVEAAEAEKMAAAGARILSRYHIGGQVFCDVQEGEEASEPVVSGKPHGERAKEEGGYEPDRVPSAAEVAAARDDSGDEAPKKRGRPKKNTSKG